MTVISKDNRFEWDSKKDAINYSKHGLRFEEIISVFDDPFFLERYDNSHSTKDEDRYLGVGCVQGLLVIVTSYTERQRIRIISARVATQNEEKIYNDYWTSIINRKN